MKTKIIPDDSRSIIEGAIKPWETKVFGYQRKIFIETILKILKEFKVNKNTTWKYIPKKVKDFLLYGDENQKIKKYNNFEGIINFIDRKYARKLKDFGFNMNLKNIYQKETVKSVMVID